MCRRLYEQACLPYLLPPLLTAMLEPPSSGNPAPTAPATTETVVTPVDAAHYHVSEIARHTASDWRPAQTLRLLVNPGHAIGLFCSGDARALTVE